jgi:putative SOS response-associated peptidase YedK
MCGRYTVYHDALVLQRAFGLAKVADLAPRFNVAPSQPVPVVGRKPDGVTRGLAMLPWGLLPAWANDPNTQRPINARSETVHRLPTFRDAFRQKRCLMPASGYYEWKRDGKHKQPFYIRRKDGGPMAFAGLWDFWTDGVARITSCCLITTDANALLAPVHNRMPVILSDEQFEGWLNPDTDEATLRSWLVPCRPDEMETYPVTDTVNKATNEGPQCIEPAA